MSGYAVSVILSLMVSLCSSAEDEFPNENVDMSSTAYLTYTFTHFNATCDPPTSDFCKRLNRDVFLNAKICSIKKSTDIQQINNYKQKLYDLVNDTSSQKCGSYEEVDIFSQMDKEPYFECGPTFTSQKNHPDWKYFSIGKGNAFTSTNWNEDIVVVAIVALLQNKCIDQTVLWYLDVFSIPTFSNESKSLPSTKFVEILKNIMTPTVSPISSTKGILLKDDPFQMEMEDVIDFSVLSKLASSKNAQLLQDSNPNSFATRLYFLVGVHCPKYYYRKGCWKYCRNAPSRLTCDPENGDEICAPGWYHSKVNYIDKIDNSSLTLEVCNMVDGCYRKSCKEKCRRTGNGTYSCNAGKDTLQIDPSYLTLLPGEIIRCYMDPPSSNLPEMFTSWQFVLLPNFEHISLSNFITSGEYLSVLSYATPGYNNVMMCLAKDSTNTTIFNTTRNYTIMRYPTLISLNVTLQHVYLGDYIECYSDAWPSSSFKYSFEIPTNNFITFPANTYGPVLYVTKTATLGEMIINCSTSFVDVNETSLMFFRLFRTYIYAFREFRWVFVKKPFYRTNDSFFLAVQVGVEYNLQILQLSGPSAIDDITHSSVSFNEGCEGGTYKFIASLYIYVFGKFVSFHRILEETIFSPPNQIQLSHIDGYPNEKVYCLVDGYPQQLVDITFVLKNENEETLLTTSRRKMRLPFDGSLYSTYRINCQYYMTVDNTLYHDSVNEAVVMKVRPQPYRLVYRKFVVPEVLTEFLIFYFLVQCILTVFVISRIRILYRASKIDFIFKTFCLYNRYRKNVRYDEKMGHISDCIFAIQKDLKPGEKLKLSTFFDYLKTKYRQSFSKGFAVVPSDLKPEEKIPDLLLPDDDLLVNFSPPKTFYGLGPPARHNIARIYNEI